MPVLPIDFLNFAKVVQASATMEREYRSVVSRAYYAAYLTASEYCRIHPFNGTLMRTGSHEKTWEQFATPIDTLGTALKGKRHQADYKLTWTVAKADAEAAIISAENIIAQINALPP